MGIWFLRIAVVYLAVGVIFGLVMGITEHFQYATAHAHINLLGWATLALSGVIYTLFPAAGGNRLAVWHFWLHNIGLPLFVIGLIMNAAAGGAAVEPSLTLLKVGSTVAILGILVFMVNVLLNVRVPRTA